MESSFVTIEAKETKGEPKEERNLPKEEIRAPTEEIKVSKEEVKQVEVKIEHPKEVKSVEKTLNKQVQNYKFKYSDEELEEVRKVNPIVFSKIETILAKCK